MKRSLGAGIATAMLVAAPMMDLAAQERQRARGGSAPAVETIMQMRDRLELTQDQIAQLDVIRAELVAVRSADQAEMAEMRSRLAAGQIPRSEMMAFIEARRDASGGAVEQTRERIDAVLTEDQRSQVEQLRERGRAFRRGAAMGRRGPPGRMERRQRFSQQRPGWGRRGPRFDRRGRARLDVLRQGESG